MSTRVLFEFGLWIAMLICGVALAAKSAYGHDPAESQYLADGIIGGIGMGASALALAALTWAAFTGNLPKS